jgi:hypothetical protein
LHACAVLLCCSVVACGGSSSEDGPTNRTKFDINVPECRTLLQQSAEDVDSATSEQERQRLESALQAQRNTLARLAKDPATKIGLAQHCKQLAHR